jgi:hypothetical protein
METIARPLVVKPSSVRTGQEEDLLHAVQRILEGELLLGSCCLVPGTEQTQHSAPVLFTEGYDGHVEVSVIDGQVTLSGEVANEIECALAGRLASSAPGCRSLVNNLTIADRA